MAHFRGTVKGARGEASRLGHKTTGLVVEAQSWQGKVITQFYIGEDGQDYARVSFGTHHGQGIDRILYDGPVSGVKTTIRRGPSKVLQHFLPGGLAHAD